MQKNTENVNSKGSKTKNGKTMLSSKCTVCGSKKIKIYEKTRSKGIMSNQELANKLHKPIIRKFEKRRVYSSFKDIISGVDLADMQLISKYNK